MTGITQAGVSEIVSGRLVGRSVVLAKPRCYMNESGRQLGPLAKFYSVTTGDIIVIHDDDIVQIDC